MNYIKINDVDSRSITGLLIQSLPSIIKPRRRYELEEIDGRDGDVVTFLGYGSADVEMSIGLRGNYNIDDVISFFDAEGTIVFSNEPTKYYKFSILEQIDFERLVTFRTATVLIHLQPFKYKVNETAVDLLTSNGVVVNSGNRVAKPILSLEGSGNISITLNGSLALQIALGDETAITIDVNALEAYNEGVLKNRLCTGDYENLELAVGTNVFEFSGTVTSAEITNYSRWL